MFIKDQNTYIKTMQRSYRIRFEEASIRFEEIDKIMDNIYDNGNYDLFKYQLEDKQKILIFHILKDFPQEIKDKICEAIDLAIDKHLLEIDFDENFYLGEETEVWDNSVWEDYEN